MSEIIILAKGKTNEDSKDAPNPGKNSPSINGNQLSLFNKLKVEFKTEYFELVQIPFLNRCYNVVSDIKARNFCALQYHPNTNMKLYPMQSKSCFKNDLELFFDEFVTKKTSNEFKNDDNLTEM